jgi:hypothetical protein
MHVVGIYNTYIAQRQNPVVGGEALVLVLKPGSDTMCKSSVPIEPYKTHAKIKNRENYTLYNFITKA